MAAPDLDPAGGPPRQRSRLLGLALVLAIALGGYYLATELRRREADRIAARDAYDRKNPYTSAQKGCQWFDTTGSDDLPALLEAGRTDELAARVDRLQKAVEKDYRCDRMIDRPLWDLANAVAMAGDRQPELLGILDRWVESEPDSYIPWMLRGRAHVVMGYRARGRGLSRDAGADQWKGMRDGFAKGRPDLERALELNPRATGAYFGLLRIVRATGPKEEAPRLLEAAIDNGLPSYRVFDYYMDAVEPRWGGSFALIEAGIEAARPYIDENPTLRIMLGHPYAVRASQARRDEDFRKAANLWRQALQYAEIQDWFLERGKALRKLRDYADSIEAFDEVIAIEPTHQDAWVYRGKSNLAIGQTEEAINDLNRAVELDPTSAWALKSRGYAYERAGRYDEALADFYMAMTLTNKPSAWHLWRIGEINYYDLERYAEAEFAFRKLVQRYPDETRGWLRYGMSLHHQAKPGARKALEHYLSMVDTGDEKQQAEIAQARRALGMGEVPGSEPAPSLPGLVSVMGGGK